MTIQNQRPGIANITKNSGPSTRLSGYSVSSGVPDFSTLSRTGGLNAMM